MKTLTLLLAMLYALPSLANDPCPPGSMNPNCSGEWPGETPDWTQRYTISCDMVNNETGAKSAYMGHGNLDYAQAGSMFVYLNNAIEDWYNDLREVAEQAGADMRLVPDPESALTNIIEIERALSE